MLRLNLARYTPTSPTDDERLAMDMEVVYPGGAQSVPVVMPRYGIGQYGLAIGPLAAPAGWPPDVHYGDVIQSAHINEIRSSVYMWPGDVNGGGKTLTNVGNISSGSVFVKELQTFQGAVIIAPAPGGNALLIYNHDSSVPLWLITENGVIQSANNPIAGLSYITFNDGTAQSTAYKGAAADQTPWLQDINAALHGLTNVSRLYTSTAAGSFELVPGSVRVVSDGTAPLVIYSHDSASVYWKIDASGNLITPANRTIDGLTSINFVSTGVNYATMNTGTGGLLFGANFGVRWGPTNDWTGGPADVMLTRAGVNALQISNPVSGNPGQLFTGHFKATGNMEVTGQGILGGTLNWPDAPGSANLDTALGRIGPGILQVYGAGGAAGDLYARNMTAYGVISTVGAAFNSDTGYRMNGTLGVSGTFTTTGGKVVTVSGGIITSIV